MPNYLFDVPLVASVRVDAATEEAARTILACAEIADAQLVGEHPFGRGQIDLSGPTASRGDPVLVEVDGETPKTDTLAAMRSLTTEPVGMGGLTLTSAARVAAGPFSIMLKDGVPVSVGITPPPPAVTADTWVNRQKPGWPWKHETGWGMYGAAEGVIHCGLVMARARDAKPFTPVYWDPEAMLYTSERVGIHMTGWEFYREGGDGLIQVRVL